MIATPSVPPVAAKPVAVVVSNPVTWLSIKSRVNAAPVPAKTLTSLSSNVSSDASLRSAVSSVSTFTACRDIASVPVARTEP